MRISKGFFTLVLFMVAGALIGGILGQLLSGMSLSGLIPDLSRTFEVFEIRDIAFNLGIMQFHFGMRFAPNLISIIGIFIAIWIYKKF